LQALTEGSTQAYTVNVSDQAGNAAAEQTGSFTVDTTAPTAPAINTVAVDDIINAAEQGETITGTNEAGATVALSIGVNTRAATVSGTTWSYTLVADDITAMGEGAETLSVTATDAAGNESVTTRDITVDTIAPTAQTLSFTEDDGANTSDGITSNGEITVANLETGASWEYSVNSGTAWATGTGTTFTLGDGGYTDGQVQVRQTDEAGNQGDAVNLGEVTVVEALADTIDLGTVNGVVLGQLIKGVRADGKVYYVLDTNNDSEIQTNDRLTHNELGAVFNEDVNGNVNSDSFITETYRYQTINGVKLALPTLGDSYSPGYQSGTAVSGPGVNDTYDDLLAIWDAYNGSGTGTGGSGVPADWAGNGYWSATPDGSGHASLILGNSDVGSNNIGTGYVALEVV
jgi:hypothetical protein